MRPTARLTTRDNREMNRSDNEIDALLLSFATPERQKVSRIIDKAMGAAELFDAERFGARIVALVKAGKLECFGDVRSRQFSEIRRP